ncbi:DUF4372 domain-containing protein [Desulfatibacillum aliphaticivorans]|uniref:DUF4372 domain-containing protein n=1 Tax=Desulfatibacillum aliphaticivorans TaxID=218208 RepID=UPI0010A3536A
MQTARGKERTGKGLFRLFTQLTGLFNRNQFLALGRHHRRRKPPKGSVSWDHSIDILFCQLVRTRSVASHD